MSTARDKIEEGHKRKDPSLERNQKEVTGETGVIDVGDRAKTYTIDLDETKALKVIGKMDKNNEDLAEIATLGQEGKRFQNGQIGLIDENGEVDAELAELIRVAATGESDMIQLQAVGSDKGTTFVEILVGGRWSTDVLRFEGEQLNDVLAELSDIPAVCDALPTLLDLKNNASQIAVFDYTENDKGKTPGFFAGSDADVDSQVVKQLYGGSSMTVDEAAALAQYALSAEGQADDGVHVDFNGAGLVLSIDTRNDGTTDTIIMKGDAFFEALSTSSHNGKSIVDLKNSASQLGVFDFDEASRYFHGSTADVDSAAAKGILSGSSMNGDDAEALVALALTGEDPNVRYLGGDDGSAIVAVDASRDTTDTLLFFGGDLDFA